MSPSEQDTVSVAAAPKQAGTRLADYRPPTYLVDTVDLRFELDPAATLVSSRLAMRRNPDAEPTTTLRLDGEALTLLSVKLDGQALSENRYSVADGALTIAHVPERFTLEIETRIAPEANSELSGLYVSNGSFFTQCEAEGFRRITFFPDRPDVMARYSTTIIADKKTCPILLSNGNPDGQGESQDGRHWAKWTDPHPKPSYLFALVAGDLVPVRDRFTTRSGRDVALAIWVREGDEDRCAHAMQALKTSMKWDEDTYGLEYDLDVFNIAAVADFNMGAMENKGLNIFNTKYVLARPETATDTDYQDIQTVIAHEYFHNWTGDRVTCRDWFQLSLKEGLTVFRDQQFTSDQGSAAVKRLRDVRRLRAAQFPEDDGPLAHPVRPDAYVKIDNFYTATVYQKGAEVVRMIRTLLGKENFRKGMDLYIARHDNHAVTIEDFVGAMQDASGIDLTEFMGWYSQAGTPEVTVDGAYDPQSRRYTLKMRQATRPTPRQNDKKPLPIPLAMGLLDPSGRELPTRLAGEQDAWTGTRILLFQEAQQDFVFEDVPAPPVPSVLRGFSAPVKLKDQKHDWLRFLAAHDTDPFVRWDSGQQYATSVLLDLIAARRQGGTIELDTGLLEAVETTLDRAGDDPAFAAEALVLPGEAFIADQMETADVEAIHDVRQFARTRIGEVLRDKLRRIYDAYDDAGPYSPDGASIGRRALKNACLAYLAAAGADGIAVAKTQFDANRNMTDVLAALAILSDADVPQRYAALEDFHARWRHDDLVLDKWFMIQAASSLPGTIEAVRNLYRHPDFDLRNPNRARSLIGAFAAGNQLHFHAASGEGYRFLADAVMALDPMNGQVAARMVTPLGRWRRQDEARQALMKQELERIQAMPGLSTGTKEMVTRSLA